MLPKKWRFFFYFKWSAFILPILFFFISCGGNNSDVSGQNAGAVLEAFVKASIFSSVPKGGGTKPCSVTCEFSYTAGTNEILKAQGNFSSLNFKCDANGVPETGQGIETQFTFDSSDPDVLEGGTVEVSCGPTGATLIDNITFNFFSDSTDFIAQECIKGGNCTLTLELTSLKDQLNQSGLLTLLSHLKCPSLDLADELFCSTNTPPTESQPEDSGLLCKAIESARIIEGCTVAPTHTCGNNEVEEGEECDGTDVKNCPPGAVCAASGEEFECSCRLSGQDFCGNGALDQGEECDGRAVPCPPGSICSPPGTINQCSCVPEATCTCDGVFCPHESPCDPANHCLCTPICIPTQSNETNCTDKIDNDCNDGIDCGDPDCGGDSACASSP